jgi:UPF0755 protein
VSNLDFSTSDASSSSSRGIRPGCLIGLVLVLLLAAGGAYAYSRGVDLLKRALSGPPQHACASPKQSSTVLRVKPGDTWTDEARTLCRRGIISDYYAFIDAANHERRTLQPGAYRLQAGVSTATAVKTLADPNKRLFTAVTFPEGLRASEILQTIVAKTHFSRASVHRAYVHVERTALPPYASGNAEGYLYPATYDVEPGMTAETLLKQMVSRFEEQAAASGLRRGAARLGYSPGQIVTVASLVQAEARRTQDMPKVAAVVYNRLTAGMPLQFDSTLHYAEGSRGTVTTSKAARHMKSPYNTYLRTGLPPTPIDSPGAAALHAALHPAHAPYLYFVTVNLRTGQTRFATTYAQHLRNVAKYRHYCRSSSAC